LLPLGKTRHAVVISNRRLFYIRYRRPVAPLWWLGVDLRIDSFRHDHDIFYGHMRRTVLQPIHNMVHHIGLRERFTPGIVSLQCKFGALQITRGHGDVLDVYQLVCQLSRNTSGFVTQDMLEENGLDWDKCREPLETSLERKSAIRWAILPQHDDSVEPVPEIHLNHSNEQVFFHMSFKDVRTVLDGCYSNVDVVVTTGRLFVWERDAYKKWDCESCLYYLCFWKACLRLLKPARNLPNTCSFFTLPSLLSFSTDLSVDPPSWLVPHHQPFKLPCCENLGLYLTHGRTRGSKGFWSYGCCPHRTGPSSHIGMHWRLKTSATADQDFIVALNFKPFSFESSHESDAEDAYAAIGYTWDEFQLARRNTAVSDVELVEALRKIMYVVQDQCHKLLDQVDIIY